MGFLNRKEGPAVAKARLGLRGLTFLDTHGKVRPYIKPYCERHWRLRQDAAVHWRLRPVRDASRQRLERGAVAGTMRIFLRALVAAAALCPATAFVHPARLGPPTRRGRPLQAIPIQSVVLGLLAAQSVRDLVIEVPRLGGESADWIGVVIDAGFLGFAGKTLLTQTGVVDATAATADRTVEGLKCTVTVNVGREPNTWMPKDWAASGARLLLPLDVEFADERVDLGFPGEEALGGRGEEELRRAPLDVRRPSVRRLPELRGAR